MYLTNLQHHLKRALLGLCIVLVSGGSVLSAQDARKGWIEGTVRDATGKAWGSDGSLRVEIYSSDGKKVASESPDKGAGGLYEFRNLEPGIYELRLVRGLDTSQAPQRVFGIEAKAGQRAVFNFVTKTGDDVIEIGKPVVVTQAAVPVSETIARLTREIETLKSEIAALKK